MAGLNLDMTGVSPAEERSAIPAGEYLAVITESEMKTTKSGNGQFLQLTFEVIEGEFKGRKVWHRLNLNNPNSQAVEIARRELKAIMVAVNFPGDIINDSADLHNLPLTIKVKAKQSDDGEVQNEIKSFKAKGTPTFAAGGTPAAAGAAPAGDGKPPWAK